MLKETPLLNITSYIPGTTTKTGMASHVVLCPHFLFGGRGLVADKTARLHVRLSPRHALEQSSHPLLSDVRVIALFEAAQSHCEYARAGRVQGSGEVEPARNERRKVPSATEWERINLLASFQVKLNFRLGFQIWDMYET